VTYFLVVFVLSKRLGETWNWLVTLTSKLFLVPYSQTSYCSALLLCFKLLQRRLIINKYIHRNDSQSREDGEIHILQSRVHGGTVRAPVPRFFTPWNRLKAT
jgi:hypothetical protein